MPTGIVTEIQTVETCPALECNLSQKDVEQFVEELDRYTKLFEPAFRRREQWNWGQVYLQGLLGGGTPQDRRTDRPGTGRERARGEIGFDHYETRSWLGLHHHMLLVSLAHYFLVRLRLKL